MSDQDNHEMEEGNYVATFMVSMTIETGETAEESDEAIAVEQAFRDFLSAQMWQVVSLLVMES